MAVEDGLVRDVLGDHRLPETLGRDEDDVPRALDEVEAERGFDCGLVDAGRPRPVEARHRRHSPQLAPGEPTLDAADDALLGFFHDEVAEQLGGAPARLRGASDDIVEVVGCEVQPEFAELLAERDGSHDSPAFFESES